MIRSASAAPIAPVVCPPCSLAPPVPGRTKLAGTGTLMPGSPPLETAVTAAAVAATASRPALSAVSRALCGVCAGARRVSAPSVASLPGSLLNGRESSIHWTATAARISFLPKGRVSSSSAGEVKYATSDSGTLVIASDFLNCFHPTCFSHCLVKLLSSSIASVSSMLLSQLEVCRRVPTASALEPRSTWQMALQARAVSLSSRAEICSALAMSAGERCANPFTAYAAATRSSARGKYHGRLGTLLGSQSEHTAIVSSAVRAPSAPRAKDESMPLAGSSLESRSLTTPRSCSRSTTLLGSLSCSTMNLGLMSSMLCCTIAAREGAMEAFPVPRRCSSAASMWRNPVDTESLSEPPASSSAIPQCAMASARRQSVSCRALAMGPSAASASSRTTSSKKPSSVRTRRRPLARLAPTEISSAAFEVPLLSSRSRASRRISRRLAHASALKAACSGPSSSRKAAKTSSGFTSWSLTLTPSS
mmetsp:Transcript_23574/g.56367  ORF Transcript_23574/g.56367 Transcript_23574/m.56367 type:complete len:477 (-) Transcript_23574:467-1897(-)